MDSCLIVAVLRKIANEIESGEAVPIDVKHNYGFRAQWDGEDKDECIMVHDGTETITLTTRDID